jgi:hypothetical protein
MIKTVVISAIVSVVVIAIVFRSTTLNTAITGGAV